MTKGLTLYELGVPDKAIPCYDQALKSEPRNAAWWNDKAAALLDAFRFHEAISCLDSALEAEPRNALAWFNKGIAQEKVGGLKEAVASFRQFLEIAPSELSTLVNEAQERLKRLIR